MAGLVKPRTLPIEDTNIANLGSELEKKVKLSAAQKEEQWKDAGKKPGLEIWRIEQFRVVDWPKDMYGSFYAGDSYIVLHTYKKDPASAKLSFDVHFWLGKNTSLDEAGTAAYKTVELDDVLGGVPVQHREVQESESPMFMAYFPFFTTLEGGAETGFKHVKPEEYAPRLLHLKGRKPCVVRQVNLSRDSLNSGDVFILDLGLRIYQFNGKDSSGFERAEAAKLSRALDDSREGRAQVFVSEEGSHDSSFNEFWTLLGGKGPIKTAAEGGPDKAAKGEKRLLRVSDASGTLKCEIVAEGKSIKRSMLQSSDVFLLDSGFQVYAWIGKGASPDEKRNGLAFAERYLKSYNRPPTFPIARVLEGGENEDFETSFN